MVREIVRVSAPLLERPSAGPNSAMHSVRMGPAVAFTAGVVLIAATAVQGIVPPSALSVLVVSMAVSVELGAAVTLTVSAVTPLVTVVWEIVSLSALQAQAERRTWG